MYDRYAIYSSQEELEQQFGARMNAKWSPNYNASPSQLLPIITNENSSVIEQYYWGIPQDVAKNKTVSTRLFNVTLEQATTRPVYKSLLQKQRCIIVANGFYVWKQLSKKQKVPYYCHLPKHPILAFAGIWEHYDDLDGNQNFVFNLITIPATPSFTSFQPDLPLILHDATRNRWLQEGIIPDGSKIISISESLTLHAVNPNISNPNLNFEEMIRPAPPSDQFGNYTLFS